MKRWIHATSSTQDQIRRINNAKKALEQFDSEKVEYVRECQDEITKAISGSYTDDDEENPIGPKLSEIKRDYLIGAIENDLMTEEEFEEIFDLIDVVSLELSAPYA